MTTERAAPRADGHPTDQQRDGHATQQELLSGVALTAFRLNGQFLAVAEEMARPAGLTAAWWQVLGAVLREPLPVAGIAREMGITRQSVQRIADLLVERGYAAVRRIDPAHAEVAGRLAAELGVDELRAALGSMRRLSEALERIDAPPE